ncbi:rhodanese-like domain-containing protein [Polaribacter litorisediminis]|uniref:rhodanese-like domain-containing protein n=1 Tax=Polaribacter litorisediminis TaxID=1908341 RepID=UPI001CBE2601|nr:rhodanese-like domain-containing protein [Polaribacter litorisediminis]UAM97492.1 rhodanese-like domain-containing protein [Polaribacter litorisediminis]
MNKAFYIFLLSIIFINCDKKQEIERITTLELRALLAKDSIQLLDVRTPGEIKAGFIKTALFADYFDADFYTKAKNQLDTKKPVYLYCRSGNRSETSARILQENGFKVVNVLGGYNQWKMEN